MKLTSLDAIASALRDADVRYLIVGGLAVAAHGFGRVTFDLDLVLQMQPDNLRRAMAALESLRYHPTIPVPVNQFADAAIRESWIRDKNMVVFQMHSDKHQETRIDLFVAEPFNFDIEYDTALVGEILPGLAGLPARSLAEATGLTRAYCARVLTGEKVPHPRWWERLRALGVLTRSSQVE